MSRLGPVDVACSSGKTVFSEGSSAGLFLVPNNYNL